MATERAPWFVRNVGRLVELRFEGGLERADMSTFRLQAATNMLSVPGRVVFLSDLRKLDLLDQVVFDNLVEMLRTDNPKVERNAMIVGTASSVAMQLERLVVQAGHPGRRVFRSAGAAVRWIEEVLSAEEITRARVFLGVSAD